MKRASWSNLCPKHYPLWAREVKRRANARYYVRKRAKMGKVVRPRNGSRADGEVPPNA